LGCGIRPPEPRRDRSIGESGRCGWPRCRPTVRFAPRAPTTGTSSCGAWAGEKETRGNQRMRELQVCPTSKRKPAEVVSRLEFSADGGELVAWVGVVLHAYDLRADAARVLFNNDMFDGIGWYDSIP